MVRRGTTLKRSWVARHKMLVGNFREVFGSRMWHRLQILRSNGLLGCRRGATAGSILSQQSY
jgi:hypothetical protein